MPKFSLQLEPMIGSDDWSCVVRNQVGAIVTQRRFLPNRLTAEQVGQAEIRRLSITPGGLQVPTKQGAR